MQYNSRDSHRDKCNFSCGASRLLIHDVAMTWVLFSRRTRATEIRLPPFRSPEIVHRRHSLSVTSLRAMRTKSIVCVYACVYVNNEEFSPTLLNFHIRATAHFTSRRTFVSVAVRNPYNFASFVRTRFRRDVTVMYKRRSAKSFSADAKIRTCSPVIYANPMNRPMIPLLLSPIEQKTQKYT